MEGANISLRVESQLLALLSAMGLIVATAFQLGWMVPFALWPLARHLSRSGSVSICLVAAWLYQGYIHIFAVSFSWVGWSVLVTLKTVPFLLLGLAKGKRFDAITLACAWTLAEWLNSIGPYGHTGGSLSHLLADSPYWIQTARWSGCFFTTLFLVWLGATLVKPTRHSLVGSLLIGGLILVAWLTRAPAADSQPLMVGLVQTQMESRRKFKEPKPVEAAERLLALTAEAGQGADLVIWPETAFPWSDLRWDPEWSRRLGQLTATDKFALIAGSLSKVEGGWQNTLHLVSAEGRFSESYGKKRLVPLVEYLPDENWRKFSLFQDTSEIVAGSGDGLFNCGEAQIGVMVCWESMSPLMARSLVDQGSTVLVVATNDQWFKGTDVALYHLQMSVFRAVESGRPVLHVGNGGYTAHIDSRGRIVGILPEEERGVMRAGVKPDQTFNFYSRFGDWPLIIFLMVLLAGYLSRANRQGGPLDSRNGDGDD
jgi:apolipoprotein N-acyltransferase